jgi:hypothetical protein
MKISVIFLVINFNIIIFFDVPFGIEIFCDKYGTIIIAKALSSITIINSLYLGTTFG